MTFAGGVHIKVDHDHTETNKTAFTFFMQGTNRQLISTFGFLKPNRSR